MNEAYEILSDKDKKARYTTSSAMRGTPTTAQARAGGFGGGFRRRHSIWTIFWVLCSAAALAGSAVLAAVRAVQTQRAPRADIRVSLVLLYGGCTAAKK